MGAESETRRQQLRMIWPTRRPAPAPVPLEPGLVLRTYREGDQDGYLDLIELAGFGRWGLDRFRDYLDRTLPDGLFLVVDAAGGKIVATAQALHFAAGPQGFLQGELGWVAADPAYRGRGLGSAVCAAVTRRFLEAGYRRIFLKTDDFRLPALKTYLKLGYEPDLFATDMPERWRAICSQLNWPFAPHEWPGIEQAP